MNAKQSFFETGHGQHWENMAETSVFKAAVNFSMLRMLERLEPTEAGAMRIQGALEFVKILETIHIPYPAVEKLETKSNLNHKA